MTNFRTIQTTSSNYHCSIGLNTYNNIHNQSPHCRCINNNPITCSCTKNQPKTKSSVLRLECLHQTWVLMKERKMIENWNGCACSSCSRWRRWWCVCSMFKTWTCERDNNGGWKVVMWMGKKFSHHGNLTFSPINVATRFRVLCCKIGEWWRCLNFFIIEGTSTLHIK